MRCTKMQVLKGLHLDMAQLGSMDTRTRGHMAPWTHRTKREEFNILTLFFFYAIIHSKHTPSCSLPLDSYSWIG